MKNHGKWALVYCTAVCIGLLATAFGNRVVTVMSENRSVGNKHCIVIDPGHGGEDGGAVSIRNLPESRYNLEISLRLQDMFHLLGYQTRMIRTEDVSIFTKGDTLAQKKTSDLMERVRIANETEGALLLSIHQNHFPDSQYAGAQVFFAQTEGSEDLAKQIQNSFITSVNPGSKRQVKKAEKVYLMTHIQCPGVLIECGFLSNPQEERMLRDPEYQKKLVSVIAAATGTFLSNT